jgi:hypothetical protein
MARICMLMYGGNPIASSDPSGREAKTTYLGSSKDDKYVARLQKVWGGNQYWSENGSNGAGWYVRTEGNRILPNPTIRIGVTTVEHIRPAPSSDPRTEPIVLSPPPTMGQVLYAALTGVQPNAPGWRPTNEIAAERLHAEGLHNLAWLAEQGMACTYCHLTKDYKSLQEANDAIDLPHLKRVAAGMGIARAVLETTIAINQRRGTAPDAPVARATEGELVEVNPASLRYSQTTAGGRGRADALRTSMGERGYSGDPIDVVKMQEGLVTLDNTRPAVAAELGIKSIPARVHAPGDPLPPEMVGRFGDARTWGEAAAYRTANQRPPLPPSGTTARPRLPGPKK